MVLDRLFGRAKRPRYFSACNLRPGDRGYGAAALDAEGRVLWTTAMPARGHAVEIASHGRLVAIVDRKPGQAITLCDPATGKLNGRLTAAPGYGFDGHAVFSSDADTLYATESAEVDQQGRIAVFDLNTRARVHEFSSHGIEPHELIWLEQDRLLAIGNGGIRDRKAVEAEIASSLAIIDVTTGATKAHCLLEEDFVSLSIRHLALSTAGEVLFAMQDQDAGTDWRPMAGLLTLDRRIEFLDMPREALVRLRGYCGSAAVDASREIAAVSSPHGGVAAFWRIADRRFLGLAELRDGCGIAAAPEPGTFVFTSGSGTRLRVKISSDNVAATTIERPADHLPQWDNHLTAMPAAR